MGKVFVGKIVNTHGIKGEVRIKSDFDRKDLVFLVGNMIIIKGSNYEISSYRVHKGYDMITLKGFDDINDVLPFKGMNVFVERDNLKVDAYIYDDLIGNDVYIGDELLGRVKDYMNGENPLLEVTGATKSFYIPLKANFIINVDLEKKIVYLSDDAKGLILWK